MFGRKNFFLICIALFTTSSLLYGFAWNLQALLVFRVIQGLAGGGMTPVAQSILAAAFPPAKRSQGFALYGIAVVVAPASRADTRRLVERQFILALVLSHQRAGRTDLARADLHDYAEFAGEEKERDRLWARGVELAIAFSTSSARKPGAQPACQTFPACAGQCLGR